MVGGASSLTAHLGMRTLFGVNGKESGADCEDRGANEDEAQVFLLGAHHRGEDGGACSRTGVLCMCSMTASRVCL
jgi:hypothetical protein